MKGLDNPENRKKVLLETLKLPKGEKKEGLIMSLARIYAKIFAGKTQDVIATGVGEELTSVDDTIENTMPNATGEGWRKKMSETWLQVLRQINKIQEEPEKLPIGDFPRIRLN